MDGASIDLKRPYRLLAGTRVIARSDDSVQIGAEPPRWVLLRDAPVEALDVLNELNGSRPAGEVLVQRGADPVLWADLFSQMQRRGLLVPVSEHSFAGLDLDTAFAAERDSLAQRFGVPTARRLLAARAETQVVVRGSGLVAAQIADLFAASGIGRVHQAPERSGPGRSDQQEQLAAFAQRLQQVSRRVRTAAPAPHRRPSLVVLAGEAPEAPWDALHLLRERVPHLAVRTQLTWASVGPLVLPGRSTCLLCVLHHRNAVDLGWSAFEAGLRLDPLRPPRALVAAAATLAAMDGLVHVDGEALPATVDGTVEWWAGDLTPRRRSWRVHPDCECHRIRRERLPEGEPEDTETEPVPR